MESYQDINARAVDSWAKNGWEWSIPIDSETYSRAKKGEWSVLLTPITPVPNAWFGDIRGKKLLGLASGGGQQMPIFAAVGADCTVLDYSERQLESERTVAAREGYDINVVRADMTKRLPFDDASFDIIFHPVSNCYVEEVMPIWRECFRILKPGGRLLAGFDNSLVYLFDDTMKEPLIVKNKLPLNPLRNAEKGKSIADEDGSVQFSHSLTEQLGGQMRAGFVLMDMYEDGWGGNKLAEYVPLFIATLALKP